MENKPEPHRETLLDWSKKTGKQKSGDSRKQTVSNTRTQIRFDFQKAMLTPKNGESMAIETYKMIDAFVESEPLAPKFTDNDLLIMLGALSICKKESKYEGKSITEERFIHQFKILDVGAEREKIMTTCIKEYASHA
ncbi:hypothetical protein [Enterobacter wuhouensis]|uniref:hypothetical protein n=1 Tax=Enterobacter wuhouensis TaxID=2529381 RepID=UPI003D772B17